MTEQQTMQRPSHLVTPVEVPIQSPKVKGSALTVQQTTFKTDKAVLEDSQAHLEAVLNHPKAQRTLDEKEQKFVSAYLLTKNASQSAIDAGYASATAKSKSCKWVRCDIETNPKPHVFRALHLESQKIHAKTVQKVASQISSRVIDTQYVLDKSVELLEKSSGNIPTHKTRRVDPLTKAEIEIEHYDYNGAHASKAIELIAKNKKVKAFSNELEINTDSSLAQLLVNLSPQVGLPPIEHDIEDAEIVETPELMRPQSLPEQ